MKRARSSVKKYIESSDSEDNLPLKRPTPDKKDNVNDGDSSSSESDIENYLQRPEKMDFDSEFFTAKAASVSEFASIENNILAGVRRLSDSESDTNDEASQPASTPKKSQTSSRQSFNQFENYTKQMEEAKKQVDIYKTKKQALEKQMDIGNLLAVGEGKTFLETSLTAADFHDSDFESCDSEQEDWEEVKNLSQTPKSIVPDKGLQIVVDMPGAVMKKKGVDLVAAMKRRLNRIRKDNQLLVHKVHLLCWIAHGNYVNSVVNDSQTLALALSLLPSQQSYPSGRTDLTYLERITTWYHKTVENIEKPTPKDLSLADCLHKQMDTKQAYNKKMLALIFVAILRALGIQTRIVMSLQVEPLRPPASDLHSLSTKVPSSGKSQESQKSTGKDKAGSSSVKPRSPKGKVVISIKKSTPVKGTKAASNGARAGEKEAEELKVKKPNVRRSVRQTPEGHPTKKSDESAEKEGKSAKDKGRKSGRSTAGDRQEKAAKQSNNNEKPKSGNKPRLANLQKGKPAPESKGKNAQVAEDEQKSKTNRRASRRSKGILQVDGLDDSESEAESKKPTRSRPNLKMLKKGAPKKAPAKPLKIPDKRGKSDSESEFEASSSFTKRFNQAAPDLEKLANLMGRKTKPLDVKKEIVGLIKGRISEQKQAARSRVVKKRKSSQSDSDYAPEPVRKKVPDSGDDFSPKSKVKRRIPVRPEPEEKTKKQGCDVWLEVFLESEEKWISVDVAFGQVHCIKNIVQRATHPIAYVLAWDSNNNVKDVSKRYCEHFNTVTRKLRIEQKWWNASLKPFQGVITARDREEDEDLARLQLDQPLPKVISEYKDHPLYALRRHLLKFEALYPPDPPTLGFVRGEAVYPRTCVYTLHSRDIWLKQAKVVKMGEKPYKIVKARPKWDKLSNKVITDQLLEIFGSWQVEDYEPPTAENGIVPRNAFGNVDLFKPCMLPKGCVHLRLPGLNKIAKRMNIDCASAIVGFDFHGGWSHPCYDGFVVCKEHEDQLICAWDNEQEELERKEQMQLDKRVYGNWKKLIRGLLIRERLKAKYDFGAPSASSSKPKKRAKKATLCTKRV